MFNKKLIALAVAITAGVFLCSCNTSQDITETREIEIEAIEEDIFETEISIEETEVEEQEPEYRYVAAAAVNFRQTPSTHIEPIQVLEFQTEIEYLTEINGWTMVHYGERDGFISSELLSEEYPDEPIPEPAPAISNISQIIAVSAASTQPTIVEGGSGTYLGSFWITHYCPCEICCGPGGGHHTASGTVPTVGRTCAADRSIPFGTQLSVNGHVYTVEDRGGAVNGNHLDIFVASHAEAQNTYYADVYLIG